MARLLHFAAAVALGGLATAGLTACTGDAEASPSPTPLVTVSTEVPSPTPTLTAEEELLAQIPEDARTEDFVGATNFSRFFFELYGPLFAEGYDTELFEYVCGDGDTFCENALESVAGAKADGGVCEGGEFSWTTDAVRGGYQDDGFMYVTQRYSVTDTTCFEADGSLHGVEAGGTGEVGTRLAFEEGSWRVYGVEFAWDDE